MPFMPYLKTARRPPPARIFTDGREKKAKRRATSKNDAMIAGRDIWKVFGRDPVAAMDAARAGNLTKEEIRDRLDAIIGVAGIDLDVGRGEFFCIMGLSGSGKSTLLRHLNRLIEPTAGTIKIDGEDIGQLKHRELLQLRAEKISMVFQSTALFPHRTVLENVAFGLEVRGLSRAARHKRAMETLELVQLAGWARYRPQSLSGGMRQRVGLARAIATDADILLMDEPFGALDPLIRRQLQDEFLALTRRLGKTTIFITHDLDEAIRLGDRIAIMKEGRFVQVGTAEEIVTRPADGYVADFVRGISRLKLVRAQSVMQPLEAFCNTRPKFNLAGLRQIQPDADLECLIALKADELEPVLVVNRDQTPIGIITIVDVLNGIRGPVGESKAHGIATIQHPIAIGGRS